MKTLLLALTVLCVPMLAYAQPAPSSWPTLPSQAIAVRCVDTTGLVFQSCGGSGSAGTDVNISGIGGNPLTTTLPVSGTVAFSNTSIGVTHANFANLDAALSTLANQATLALIKAKTDNLDVLLSTRTKPADQQHAIIDSGSVTFTNASISITGSVAVTGTFFQPTQPVSLVSVPSHDVTNAGTFAVQASGSVTANAGSNLNTSLLALEAGGNLAAIKTDVDKIPSQGQALAANSTPVVLPATQITALTPPAALTNFALETGGNLASLTAKDFATSALQTALNTLISSVQATLGATAPTKADLVAGADSAGVARVPLVSTAGVPLTQTQLVTPLGWTYACNAIRRTQCR